MWRDTIIVEEDNRIFATGGNVWINAGKIADLFNITAASVNRAVKQVLKADVLNDYEVLKLVRLDNGLLILCSYHLHNRIKVGFVKGDTTIHNQTY